VMVSNSVGATKQLQIGVSAANPENLFALQSLVREKVTEFVIAHHPESIVRTRSESLTQPATPSSPPTDLEHGTEHARAGAGIAVADEAEATHHR
jgi:hypothetical protein